MLDTESKVWIPVFTGMTMKIKGMTVIYFITIRQSADVWILSFRGNDNKNRLATRKMCEWHSLFCHSVLDTESKAWHQYNTVIPPPCQARGDITWCGIQSLECGFPPSREWQEKSLGDKKNVWMTKKITMMLFSLFFLSFRLLVIPSPCQAL